MKLPLLSLLSSLLGGADPPSYNHNISLPQPTILSSLYGYDGCIGVDSPPSASNLEETEAYYEDLEKRGCVVLQDPETGEYRTNAALALRIKLACQSLSDRLKYLDGNVIVFNFPLEEDTIQNEDIQVELSDGSIATPDCILLGPADEEDELNTALLLGQFGDGLEGQVHPQKISIIGDVTLNLPNGTQFNAKGLIYNEPSEMTYSVPPKLNMALIYSADYEIDHHALLPSGVYPNRCRDLFPETTVVIKTIFSGGVTLNGVNSVLPNMKDVFEVYLTDGTKLTENQVLGLSDLGNDLPADEDYSQDGDNLIDICLLIDNEIAEDISKVKVTCDPDLGTQLFAPKGRYPCEPRLVQVRPMEEFRVLE